MRAEGDIIKEVQRPQTHRLAEGQQYGLTWDMVDFRSRMLGIPRAKN